MREWQDIDSAPKDGTLIFIREARGRIQVAKWCSFGYCDPGWFVQLTQVYSDDRYPTMNVTHWMPLPPPGEEK